MSTTRVGSACLAILTFLTVAAPGEAANVQAPAAISVPEIAAQSATATEALRTLTSKTGP